MLNFPNIDPVALAIGPMVIRWYALAYVLGILLGLLYLSRLNKRLPFFTPKALDDLVLYGVLGILLGGRLGYIFFYQFAYYAAHPIEIFYLWQGGMAFHGGLLGVVVAYYRFARTHQLPFLSVMDRIALVAPIGLCLGRLANFINGELYGRVSSVPWAMIFPADPAQLPRHPSQLYQAAGEGLFLGVLLYLLARFTPLLAHAGRASGVFLVGYGVARVVAECFRAPDAHLGFLAFGATMGQLLSVPMILLGVVLLRRSRRSA
jgi:phosphatidylglycerol:prolipoprotein diacylglycerol transferase